MMFVTDSVRIGWSPQTAARAAARYARRTTHEERKSELTPVEGRVGKLHKKLHTA